MTDTINQASFESHSNETGLLEIQIPTVFSDKNTLLLTVANESVNTSQIADYAHLEGFDVKTAYHLTVIGDAVGKRLQEKLEAIVNDSEKTVLLNSVNSLTSILGKAKLKPGHYYRLLKVFDYDGMPEQRESIIQEVEIEGINDFYSRFSQLTGIELGTPFPHITLFTKGNSEQSKKGIGVRSIEYLNMIQHQRIQL